MNYETENTNPTTPRKDDEQGESCGTSSSQPSKSTSSGGRTTGSSPSDREGTTRQAPGTGNRSGSGQTAPGTSKPKTNEGKTGVSGETDDDADN